MAVIDSRTWLLHLSDAECWRLLDEHAVGRVGVLVDSAPEIYPVNYRTDGRSILFRTDPGSKLHGLERSPSACFEIDGLEPASRTGWSVLVKGRAHLLVDADEVHRGGPRRASSTGASARRPTGCGSSRTRSPGGGSCLAAITRRGRLRHDGDHRGRRRERGGRRRAAVGGPGRPPRFLPCGGGPSRSVAAMRVPDARTGIDHLDRDDCLRLLAQDEIGRLAVNDGHAPRIFPVNYRLDGEAIVFRTAPGTKLECGPRSLACFEIDEFFPEQRAGWSVVVVGRLDEVTQYDARTLARAVGLEVDPWAAGEKSHWMRLVPTQITGRQVGQMP